MAAAIPKQVQVLAEGGAALPPARFVRMESGRPIPCDAAQQRSVVPIIDLRRLIGSDGVDETAKLGAALSSWGLFQVVGHDIPEEFLDTVQHVTTIFFELPLEEKQKYTNMKEGVFSYEGYGNDRTVSEEQVRDWNDRLYLLVKPEEARNLDFWPEIPDSFKDTLHEFTEKTWNMGSHLLRGIARSLNLDEDCFSSQFGDETTVFARFNYYPSCSRPDLVFGLKPHCDASAFTVVLPDKHTGGLEVFKDGEWVGVTTLPNALLVNLGDQMEIMTNGIYKSPMHRVMVNAERARISIVMFHSVGFNREIEPANGLLGESRPRLYSKVKVKDYIDVFFQKIMSGKRGIDWAKV